MRNLFDQYDQPENRLTHALACCLQEDKRLLRRFVTWATGSRVPRGARLEIVEQRLPGEEEVSEKEAGKRGLPDAWIHDGEAWALLIESKVASPLKARQIKRHLSTARRRGFDNISLLALTVVPPTRKMVPKGVVCRRWCEVYAWCMKEGRRSEWARRLARYMEVAEARMIADEYLKEGTLTVFSGVPFDDQNPWNYREAKRILKLAMDSLQASKDLEKKLGVNPKGARRPAITGRGGSSVWDFLPLKASSGASPFTRFPHFAVTITFDRLLANLLVPHQVRPDYRRSLLAPGFGAFRALFEAVTRNLARVLRDAKGASPMAIVKQRRYPSQRSPAIHDASVEFDLRTAFEYTSTKPRIGFQPQWLEATYHALARKRSNLQLSVGASYSYARPGIIHTAGALDSIVEVWLAAKPILEACGVTPPPRGAPRRPARRPSRPRARR